MVYYFIFALKEFISNNSLLWKCCIVSFGIAAVVIPLVIAVCRKNEWYDTLNSRKVHQGSIPRLGSIGFVFGFIASSVIYINLDKDAFDTFIPFLCSGSIIFAFGIIDDFKNLKALVKLVIQCIAALIIILNGYTFVRIFEWELPVFLRETFTFFWIVGIINAYNLIDGIDGLCGGLSILAVFTYAVIFTQTGGCYAAICFLLVSSILGFLIYNKPKAKIFMGDGGSQFLGFMVSVLPLFSTTYNFELKKFIIMLNLVAVPVLDMVAAIWRRVREHRGIMSPDRFHVHHKLMNLGFSPVQTLFLLLGIQFFVCISVGISMNLKDVRGNIMLTTTFVVVSVLFCVLHFANRAVLRKKNQENESNQ